MSGELLGPEHVTPLTNSAVAAVAWRSKGQLYVTIIAKATFAFAPDAPMPRTEPQEILRAEVHHGKNPGRSIQLTSDLAPYLGRADVLFTGSAHAPPESPVLSLPVRLAIFAEQRPLLDKRLLVQDLAGFQRMPIVYERALRGVDEKENPLGLATSGDEPNIKDPARPEHAAGFGPIGRVWPARKRLLGSTPRAALDGPIAEIPEGFDWAYFQAAPIDQRTDYLRGDEWIILEGLHPSLPRLRTRLPGARGRARVYGLEAFGVSEGTPLELSADTLRIDGDAQRCTVVWRRSFPVAGEGALAALQVVAGVEVAGEGMAWPDPPTIAGMISDEATSAIEMEEVALRPIIEVEADAPRTAMLAPLAETLAILPTEDPPTQRPVALPFQPVAPAPALPAQPAPHASRARVEPLLTGTLTLSSEEEKAAARRPGLPFPAAPGAHAPSAALATPGPDAREAGGYASVDPPPMVFAPRPVSAQPLFVPPAPPRVAALPLGLQAASDAAAAVTAPERAGTRGSSAPPAALPEEVAEPAVALDLLWFDSRSMPRIRKQPAWREILEGLEDKPLDPDIDDPELDVEPVDAEQRREIFEVLAHGKAMNEEAIRGALKGAVRSDGRFVAPLVLLEGSLAFPFDELETLKAMVAVVSPLAGGEERLKGALTAARDFLQTLDPLSSRSAALGLSAAIKEAYTVGKPRVPFVEVEIEIEQVLLEHRRYQRRAVFGGGHLRCLVQPAGAPGAIPAYLPEALAEVLPMFQRFSARVIAEAHLPADQREAHPVALRGVAVARIGEIRRTW